MAMSISRVCDECGKPAVTSFYLATGHVCIDGVAVGQDVDFCEEHNPSSISSKECKRVEFVYPGLTDRKGDKDAKTE